MNYGNARALLVIEKWITHTAQPLHCLAEQSSSDQPADDAARDVLYTNAHAFTLYAHELPGDEPMRAICAADDDSWHARHQNIAPVTPIAAADRKLLLHAVS